MSSPAIAFFVGMIVGAAAALFGVWLADLRAQREEWRKWERRARRTRWFDVSRWRS